MDDYSSIRDFSLGLHCKRLPPDITEKAEAALEGIVHEDTRQLLEKNKFRPLFLKAISFSPFVRKGLETMPDLARQLIEYGTLLSPLSEKDFMDSGLALLEDSPSEEVFFDRIRRFRKQNSIRIAIRDIGGLSDFIETSRELSLLASACIETALKWVEEGLVKRFGTPVSKDGERIRLIVLGMGKLGARELNFSSDIDLIFSYPSKDSEIFGLKKDISIEEYFSSVARQLIKALSYPTAQGIVFRTDTRLRPFGDSGPLVMSSDAMVEYYEGHGRQWERYALIKASPVAGDRQGGKELLDKLHPFIYRKYIDYSTVNSLKEMKSMILAEQAGKDVESNVKLGPGGIRDIEFVVQTFQLIKGGRIKPLQVQGLLDALEVIERLGLLPEKTCRELARAYVFLRTTENRLQEYDDRQVQTLPKSENSRYRLALSLGYDSWNGFLKDYRLHTGNARKVFQGLFKDTARKKQGKGSVPEGHKEWLDAVFVWSYPADPKAVEILRGFSFKEPGEIARLLLDFRESKRVRSLPGRVQDLLDTLVPRLIIESSKTSNPDKALRLSLFIFESVLKRSIYLVLLHQNPPALKHLVYLCSKSRLIGELLRRQPILLDELVSADALFRPLGRQELRQMLFTILGALGRGDLEHWLDELRRFKKANLLRIAASQLKGNIEIEQVSRGLSNLAETLLEECFNGAWQDMREKAPDFLKSSQSPKKGGISVIAYGKLGSQEMSYSSDLDLVFLYRPERFGSLSTLLRGQLGYFYSRCIQRLIFFLSARTSQGVLYEIDTRLRPNGSQGILVSTISSFSEYQTQKAWTWEHQALIKARFICGDETCGKEFERTRRDVICQKRDNKTLKDEIKKMRQKMLVTLTKEQLREQFHVKKSPGGLIDIEFIAQYLVLRNAWREKSLADYRSTGSLIEVLGEMKLLGRKEAEDLLSALGRYQEIVSLKALDMEEPVASLEGLDDLRKGVLETWNKLFDSQQTIGGPF